VVHPGRVPRKELERILWDEEPEIWPYYSVAIYGVSDRLRNFEPRRDYYVLLSDVAIA
jgi:hypothetical protein